MQPHEYPRRILFCVAGMTPQIVTETLYALAVETEGRPPFVPTEIHVLSTSTGAEQVRLALLAPDRDQFGALCREHGLNGIRFDADLIDTIRDRDGQPLADIRSPEDNELAADAITRAIAELTRDPTAAVHVSIAGGRKTMGFFAGYALSLYGRAQDRLSHVLVSERFEQLRDFYFKPRRPVTITDGRGLEVSTADARIHLAEIPFVPLAEGLHKPLLDRSMGYADSVRLLRRGSTEGVLVIDGRRGRISWQGISLKLARAQLPVYLWLAERRRSGINQGWVGKREFSQDRELHQDFLRCAKRHLHRGPQGSSYDLLESTFLKPSSGFDAAEWLAPHLSRIKQRLLAQFGPTGLKQIGIESDNLKRNRTAYRLATPPELIRIESA